MAKRDTLNIRTKPELRGLIDHVAAEDALLDRTVIAVSAKAYAEFQTRLDAPPHPNQRLHRSLQTNAPWER